MDNSVTKRKKIIIVGPAYPYRGGNSLFVSHLYDLLKDHFDVQIMNYKLLYPSILFPGTTQFDKSTTLIKKAPSERVINSVNPLTWINTAKKINQAKADLIIFDWWHPFFAPCHFTISQLIRKRYRNRILFIAENFVSHEGSFIDKALTRLGLKNANYFMTLSEKVIGEIEEVIPGKKILRAELPVYDCYKTGSGDTSRKDFNFPADAKLLLFFGYIRKYKGLDVLLKAMPELIKYDKSIRLLVVGESYDDPAIYTNLIKELGIQDYVTFINTFVPNEEVGKYYMPADLVVLPYRSATQSGILNVAYGFGKPVLVTKVGGLTEFVDEDKTGVITEPESPKAIVEGVKRFFSLRDTVDFSTYIDAKNKQNLFYHIPEMLTGLLGEIEKTESGSK